MGEEPKQVNEPNPAFSFGMAEEFKQKTDAVAYIEQKVQLLQDLYPAPTAEELQRQAIAETFKEQLPMATYEYWNKRLEAQGGKISKKEFKNPLSVEVGNGVEVEPIIKPTLEGGKPAVKELGGKVKFDWHKLEVEGKVELKKGEIEKMGISISGKF